MDEKRTFGQFIKENKKKIIAGAIIVVGVAVGIAIVAKTIRTGNAINSEGQAILDGLTDGIQEVTEVLGEAA